MNDAGVSDVVGTMMLLAVAVTVAAVVAPTFAIRGEPDAPAPRLDFSVEARAGDSEIHLWHLGGDVVEGTDLVVHVLLNGQAWTSASLQAGAWGAGEGRVVALPAALSAGDRLDVALVHTDAGAQLGERSLRLPPAAPADGTEGNASLEVSFRHGKDYVISNTQDTLYLQARADHPLGRKAIERVWVNLSVVYGASETPLYDDGTHGDVVAGDGTWSTYFLVPYNAPNGTHMLNLTARAIDGSRLLASGTLNVLATLMETPLYDTSVLNKVGWNITKDPSKNTIRIALKMETAAKEVTIDGKQYKMHAVHFHYQPFKPGATEGTATITKNDCSDPAHRYVWADFSISNYDVDLDQLQYFFRVEWKPLTSGDPTKYTTIESSSTSQYFTLRASEVSKLVGHAWTSYADCTMDP